MIGLLAGVSRQASLLGAVIMPEGTARREFGLPAPALAQVETRIGAVDLIVRPGARWRSARRSAAC